MNTELLRHDVRQKIAGRPLRLIARETGVSISSLSRLLRYVSIPGPDVFYKLVAWMQADANVYLNIQPLEQEADAWRRLYSVLVELGVPSRIIDAMLVLVRLACKESVYGEKG